MDYVTFRQRILDIVDEYNEIAENTPDCPRMAIEDSSDQLFIDVSRTKEPVPQELVEVARQFIEDIDKDSESDQVWWTNRFKVVLDKKGT